MVPVTELRVSIPLAIGAWGMQPWLALAVSFLGNLVPMVAILYGFDWLQRTLSQRSRLFAEFFSKLFERTRRKFDAKYQTYGMLALCIFVAIPLPATGIWTGSLAAWLFGLKKGPSMLYIGLGGFIAAGIVTAATVGIRAAV